MSTWDDKPNDYRHAVSRIEQIRAETIEECARVADYHSAWDKTNVPVGQNIAAAIRALKDKP